MITIKKALPDTSAVSMAGLFGALGVDRFKEVIVTQLASNSGTFYLGTHAQQPVELPVGTLSFNFGNTPLSELYIHGSTGDFVVLVGIE